MLRSSRIKFARDASWGRTVLTDKIKVIHFVGIGGAGVSALAYWALKSGFTVTGSDLNSSEIITKLTSEGARISTGGHHRRNVSTADMVVYSTAINPDENVETQEGYRRKIPVVSRIDFLAYLVRTNRGIVISGAHGKSTTSALIAHVLKVAELKPSFAIGACLKNPNRPEELGNAGVGKSDLFICEGDESNSGHQELKSWVAVVTNIDDDHLDHYGSLSSIQQSFIRFIEKSKEDGAVVACVDCPRVRGLLKQVEGRRIITYGLSSEADYRAERITPRGFDTEFVVVHRSRGELGEIRLPSPGRHNVQNALAAVAVAEFCGVDFQQIAYGLETFPGLKRRFDILHQSDEIMVVDDYAHHPTEICALIETTRQRTDLRLRVVFQPHRFTRSKGLAKRFAPCFEPADEVILTDIYSAGEEPEDGMDKDYLASFFEEYHQENQSYDYRYIGNLDEIALYLIETVRPGDLILTVGAGDVFQVAKRVAEALDSQKMREKLTVEYFPTKRAEGGLFD